MRYLTFCIALFAISSARAELIVLMERTGTSVDFPQLTLTNSGPGRLLTFSLSIGNEAMNFDSATEVFGADKTGVLLVSPDAANGAVRSDVLALFFASFSAGQDIKFKLDLDEDIGPATVDWQTTLFDNGALPNAVIAATWEHASAVFTLPDAPEHDPFGPYEFVITPVLLPEPHSLRLVLFGILALGMRACSAFWNRS